MTTYFFTSRHTSYKCEVGDFVVLYDDDQKVASGYVTDYSAYWHETEINLDDETSDDGFWEYHWISLGVEWDGNDVVREKRYTANHSYWTYAVEGSRDTLKLYYVNFYLLEQHYGGPEEGGWWYVHGAPVATHSFATRSEAFAFARGKGHEIVENLNRDRPSISSVASTGIYDVRVETHLGRAFPRNRPHYC